MRVLIAEDDEPIRRLVSLALRREGFEVDAVTDGAEAIDALAEHRYDAVVLDYMMPRVDGLGVMQTMLTEYPDSARRTIFMTAYPRSIAASGIANVCNVFVKPFVLRDLLAKVRECAAMDDVVEA